METHELIQLSAFCDYLYTRSQEFYSRFALNPDISSELPRVTYPIEKNVSNGCHPWTASVSDIRSNLSKVISNFKSVNETKLIYAKKEVLIGMKDFIFRCFYETNRIEKQSFIYCKSEDDPGSLVEWYGVRDDYNIVGLDNYIAEATKNRGIKAALDAMAQKELIRKGILDNIIDELTEFNRSKIKAEVPRVVTKLETVTYPQWGTIPYGHGGGKDQVSNESIWIGWGNYRAEGYGVAYQGDNSLYDNGAWVLLSHLQTGYLLPYYSNDNMATNPEHIGKKYCAGEGLGDEDSRNIIILTENKTKQVIVEA